MKNKIIVVGDIFKNISNGESILIFTEIFRLISKGGVDNSILLVKQGVTEEQVVRLKAHLNFFGLESTVWVDSLFDHYRRCPNKLTHKVKSHNILVSEPFIQSNSSYKSILMIDERCAELSDHVTGIHLQGMVLMEASRQMTTATIEKYFIDRASRPNVKLVMNEFQSNFHRYIFPMDAEFNLKILNDRKINNTNRIFTILICIQQNGEKVAEIFRKVSMYDMRLIDYKEKTAMESYVKSVLNFEEGRIHEKAA